MDTTIEQLEMQVKSNASSAVSGIDSLSESLQRLKSATKGGIGLTGIANQVKNLDSSVKNMDSSNFDKIEKLAGSIEKLRSLSGVKISSSIGNQLKNIGQAVSSLGDINLSGVQSLNSVLQPLNSMGKSTGLNSTITALKKLPQLAQTLKEMDWGTFTSQIQKLSNALTPLASKLNTVSAAYNRLPTNIKKTANAMETASASNEKGSFSWSNLLSKIVTVGSALKRAASVIGSWITQSNQYVEDVNLFTASMGDYADEAKNYAEHVGEVLGIDPGQFMRNQGVFNTIIAGFGVASDKASLMSKNLTQLGYDISSFYNISVEDAMQKLQSGISGELEPLRRLGYDLSVARLQEEALALGITKKVSAMSQAEKSQLRYYAVMKQVQTVQGDMARTLTSPANQIRVLQAQVTQCARALGNIFIPVLNAVIPYVIAFVKVLRMLADEVAKFMGFTMPEVDYSSLTKSSTAASGLADNSKSAATNLKETSKAAKKLKSAMLGIDELNVISPDDNSSSGSGSSSTNAPGLSGSDLGIEMPTYDFLAGAVESKVDEIVEKVKTGLAAVTAVASAAALAVGTILVVTGANIPLGLGLMAVGAVGLATAIAANWNGMSEQLARTLTVITGVLGGFLLAIGAFIAFSGVNVPLGIALMVLGAGSLATAVAINWKFLEGDMSNVLSILTGIIGGALLAIGALFAFTGVSLPLGIALMAAGAVSLITAVGLNWDSMPESMRKVVTAIEAVLGGALLAMGAILAFVGINIPLGIALMAMGAVSLAAAVALNWDSMKNNVEEAVKSIVTVVSGALIGIGAILAFTGVATGLGIGLIAAGAAGLAASLAANWNSMSDHVKKVVSIITATVGGALLVVGIILAFTGVATGVGIGLIAAGAAAWGVSVGLNWNTVVDAVKGPLKSLGIIVGGAMLAIGVLLCLSGVGIPLGLGLIAAGVAGIAAGTALNWDEIKTEVKGGLDSISDSFNDFKTKVSNKLDEAKETVQGWASNAKDFFSNGKEKIKDAGAEYGDSFKNGVSEKFSNTKQWVSDKITTPLNTSIKNSKVAEYAISLKENSADLWDKAKTGWETVSKDGFSISTAVSLVKKGWKTVNDWIGNIPVVSQAVDLAKKGWKSVQNWVGKIPTVSQMIDLVKDGWDSVQSWIGDIPNLSQSIKLIKKGWKTVNAWIGKIPGLSQAISLAKKGWQTVSNWIGHIPVIGQGIKLIKKGWETVKDWIGTHVIDTGIKLIRKGWSSLSEWIGKSVKVGVSLIRDGWDSIKDFLGLSGGGVVNSDGSIRAFASGGIITQSAWKAMPKYAGGTNRAHGSMFVAGESGAELVGHVNGTTEVLNRFQLAQVMQSSIVSGMNQFAGYWQSMSRDLITCANGVINAVIVSANDISEDMLRSPSVYDPANTLSQSVYESSRRSYEAETNGDGFIRGFRDFYYDTIEPTLREIASDTKRQADKDEQTLVQIGNRVVSDVVRTQQKANGYNFIK